MYLLDNKLIALHLKTPIGEVSKYFFQLVRNEACSLIIQNMYNCMHLCLFSRLIFSKYSRGNSQNV